MHIRSLLMVYLFFFFMYFIGFGWMGNVNSGVPYPWAEILRPLNISRYVYTIIIAALAHFVVFRRYYYQRPRWKLIAAILLLLVFYIGLRYVLEEVIIKSLTGKGNYSGGTSLRFYVIDNIYFGSIIIFLGFALFLLDELFRKQQQNRAAELNFLQAQLSPHFLFNSLNNIYSLAYQDHPRTADAVLRLSDMMRYVTYERGEQVTLGKELDYARSLIATQELRQESPVYTRTDIAAGAEDFQLIPLSVISMVENAIKHGDLSDENIPLVITAEFKHNWVVITVTNKTRNEPSDIKGGVGISNLKRRLELTYPSGKYRFISEKRNQIYFTQLCIAV